MAIEIQDHTEAAPQTGTGDVVSLFNQALDSSPAETPQPAESAPAEPPAAFSIPADRVPEKFKQNPEAVFGAYDGAERKMHEATQEAAQLRREADDLRARLAATEQLTRLQQKPEATQPVDPWGGIKPEEAVITDTRRFAETTISLAEQRARQAATEAATNVARQLESRQAAKDQAQALVSTWEQAKELARAHGYRFSDAEWRQQIGYIAPAVARENDSYPGAIYSAERYVAHLANLRGAPQAPTLPTEGNPPVASRPAGVAATAVPQRSTISREEKALREQMAATFVSGGLMTAEQAKNYMEGR